MKGLEVHRRFSPNFVDNHVDNLEVIHMKPSFRVDK